MSLVLKALLSLAYYSETARKLLTSHRNEYPVMKAIGGFLFGAILGVLIHFLVINPLKFDHRTSIVLSTLITVLLGIGNALSYQMRCTCMLSIPALTGRTGRGALKAVIISYLIAGPVSNMIYNTKEVVRTFACSTVLTYNLTKTRFILMYKPFRDAVTGIRPDTSEVKDTLNLVKQVVAPISSEISEKAGLKKTKEFNDYMDSLQADSLRSIKIEKKYDTTGEKDNDKKVEEEYLKKLEYRCQGVISAAQAKCRKIFAKAEESCTEAVTVIAAWALCWPMKLTFVCNVVSSLGGDEACNAQQEISPGFGKGYNYLLNSQKMLSSTFEAPKIRFKLKKPNVPINVRGATDTSKALMREFDKKRSFAEFILLNVRRALTLVLIRIVCKAQEYQEKYITNIRWDNRFLTQYFRKIDARRREAGKKWLLPLKKGEKRIITDPKEKFLGVMDYWAKYGAVQSMKAADFGYITALTGADMLYYSTLMVVREHGIIDYHQTVLLSTMCVEIIGGIAVSHHVLKIDGDGLCLFSSLSYLPPGSASWSARVRADNVCHVTNNWQRLKPYTSICHHDLSIKVLGTGLVANIVRSITRRFNFKRNINQNFTNEVCLPRPHAYSFEYVSKCYILYMFIVVFGFIDNYTDRIYFMICSYFYPKREKRRILYLYNRTLKARILFEKNVKKAVIEKVRKNKLEQNLNVLLLLRLKFPILLGVLEVSSMARRTCLVCDEPESRYVQMKAPWIFIRRDEWEIEKILKNPPDGLVMVKECPSCRYIYCMDCWKDLGDVCVSCNPPSDDDDGRDPDEKEEEKREKREKEGDSDSE